MLDELDFVVDALKGSASDYLLKAAAGAELALAIKVTTRGQTYLTSAISKSITNRYVYSSRHSVSRFRP